MKSKKNLVLLGMMGSGKSTIGRLLSKKLNFKFFDIDKIIQKENNMKINEIFNSKGEIFFRQIEESLTIKTLNHDNCIISLGGAAFLNQLIRKKTLTKSKTFWLDWKSKTIISRIIKSKNRPVITGLSTKQLEVLIKERSNIYAKANYKINCNNLNKNEIIEKILKIYESK
jgi:shikimate kinase